MMALKGKRHRWMIHVSRRLLRGPTCDKEDRTIPPAARLDSLKNGNPAHKLIRAGLHASAWERACCRGLRAKIRIFGIFHQYACIQALGRYRDTSSAAGRIRRYHLTWDRRR